MIAMTQWARQARQEQVQGSTVALVCDEAVLGHGNGHESVEVGKVPEELEEVKTASLAVVSGTTG